MGEVIVTNSSSSSVDFWQENVPVHHGCRQLQVLVKFQTVRLSANENSKQYHISLSCSEDYNFLYKSAVTADTYERLVRYERLATPFAQFPLFVQQLIHAVRSSHNQQSNNETGERLLVNILSRSGDDVVGRSPAEIEFLVTARQSGCVVQSKRLSLSFTLASDADLKDHLGAAFQNVMREKQQLQLRVRSLETQLESRAAKIEDLEQCRKWQQNQLEMMQTMLESSQNIQRHYQSLLRAHSSVGPGGGGHPSALVERSMSGSSGEASPISEHLNESWGGPMTPPQKRPKLCQQPSSSSKRKFEQDINKLNDVPSTSSAQIVCPDLGSESTNTCKEVKQELLNSSVDDETLNDEPFLLEPPGNLESTPTRAAANQSLSEYLDSPNCDQGLVTPIAGIGSYLHCLICNSATLAGHDAMKAHFLSEHLGDSGRCPVCPVECSSTVKSSDLLSHMMSHTTRVYACQFCGKQGRIHYLKIHVRSHTGEKPYKCRVCGRGFADASTYRRHERVHTGEKPYQCPICGRQIARKDNVKVHIRSHLKDNQLPPAIRAEALDLESSLLPVRLSSSQ